MNVASLELCKKLFELSSWNDTRDDWLPDKDGTYEVRGGAWYNKNPRIPAYDLGYLLRKSGNLHIELKRPYNDSEPITLWSCMVPYDDGEELPAYLIASASTPEDAAAMLAIELFNRGVLKK